MEEDTLTLLRVGPRTERLRSEELDVSGRAFGVLDGLPFLVSELRPILEPFPLLLNSSFDFDPEINSARDLPTPTPEVRSDSVCHWKSAFLI